MGLGFGLCTLHAPFFGGDEARTLLDITEKSAAALNHKRCFCVN